MYFPVFIDLSEKELLVVGAGKIAARRIRTLCGFAGHITVTAPEIAEEIRELALKYPLILKERVFEEEDLDGKALVFAATDNRILNREIAALCRTQGIPVNVCSEKEQCDFYFPSVIEKDGVVIGINASGQNHGLVKKTRMELEEFWNSHEETKRS